MIQNLKWKNLKKIFVTVSDDRMGRKGGVYGKTQRMLTRMLLGNCVPDEMIFDRVHAVTIEDILKTSFYQQHRAMLDNVDPAKNGMLYKPFAIFEALRTLNDGDLLVYNDCSPQIWDEDLIYQWFEDATLDRLYTRCHANRNMITPFVRWDTRPMGEFDLGIHTHENFTSDLCIDTMGLRHLAGHYQHATGLMVIIKTKETFDFVNEWLYYNTDDRCACLGQADKSQDYSYWTQKDEQTKFGHRYDQSISGLLMSKYDRFLAHFTRYSYPHPYAFVNLCREDTEYVLISSNEKSPNHRIRKGDVVVNDAGHQLKVFDIEAGDTEHLLVGFHRHSSYWTTEDEVRKL